ncbi:MAG: CatB-related O-acetyltransferase [Prevotella sp.]|nr:CatB-related O-acetyltransferase [Prevotella sp.]
MSKLKYYLSKLIYYLQIPSIRDCKLAKHTRVLPRCNLIRVEMARYSYIGTNTIVSDTKIGAFCSIGSSCSIGGGMHPTDRVSTSPVFYDSSNCFKEKNYISADSRNPVKQPQTIIGNDVWIGENVFVSAGVNIGDGAVIGAHAVITKDVPPYAIVAGVPAKILRYRFDEATIKELMATQWWEWSEERLAENKDWFSKVLG